MTGPVGDEREGLRKQRLTDLLRHGYTSQRAWAQVMQEERDEFAEKYSKLIDAAKAVIAKHPSESGQGPEIGRLRSLVDAEIQSDEP